MAAFSRTARVLTAALVQLHPLLPGRAVNNLDAFLPSMEKANITKIVFLRHGKTGPSTTGHDFYRLLTEEGRDQARESGKILGTGLKPFFNPLLVSSAPRTVETAKIFVDACHEDESDTPKINIIQELYDGTMQPKGSALFKQIGYAPLRTYLDHENDDWRKDAQSVLGPYAYASIDIIMDTVALSDPAQVPSTLLVIAHAIYLPAAALGVASLARCNDVEVTLSTETQEADGYLIDLSRACVEYISWR